MHNTQDENRTVLEHLQRLSDLQESYNLLANLESYEMLSQKIITSVKPFIGPENTVALIDNRMVLEAQQNGLQVKLRMSQRWEPEVFSIGHTEDLNAPCYAGSGFYVCVMLGRSRLALYIDGFQSEPDETFISDLNSYAGFAGVAIVSVKSFQTERVAANTDSLTGLANRRALETHLRQLIKLGKTFTYVIIDLDHFKEVNDTQGHQAGDDILKKVGHCLLNNVRATDFPSRLAGDEFVVILDTHDGRAATARVRTWFHKMEVRASLGSATYPREGRTQQDLYRLADKRLYEEKNLRD